MDYFTTAWNTLTSFTAEEWYHVGVFFGSGVGVVLTVGLFKWLLRQKLFTKCYDWAQSKNLPRLLNAAFSTIVSYATIATQLQPLSGKYALLYPPALVTGSAIVLRTAEYINRILQSTLFKKYKVLLDDAAYGRLAKASQPTLASDGSDQVGQPQPPTFGAI